MRLDIHLHICKRWKKIKETLLWFGEFEHAFIHVSPRQEQISGAAAKPVDSALKDLSPICIISLNLYFFFKVNPRNKFKIRVNFAFEKELRIAHWRWTEVKSKVKSKPRSLLERKNPEAGF